MLLHVDILGSKDLFVNEIAMKGFQISREDGAIVNVTSATYQIFNKDGQSLGASGTATKTNNSTTLVDISATISAGTNVGERYVEFACVIGSYTKIVRVKYNVVK
jgi:hypothetical protein